MAKVPGIQGYDRSIDQFIDACRKLDFNELCKDFLTYLPPTPARILDAGSGAGQNAAALAEMGYSVVAIEPMPEFLAAAQNTYVNLGISWCEDSLPFMESLGDKPEQFDFILASGVWHHLSETEQKQALARIAFLLNPGGKCALTLRNGPAGLGTYIFSTNTDRTIEQAKIYGLECVYRSNNQPSAMKNKENVKWARLLLQKK